MQLRRGCLSVNMADKVSKRLVIDASVARSAGKENATYPTSKHCRDFLNTVLDISHRVVMTPDIRDEWQKHESNFAGEWRRRMLAKRKLDIHLDIVVDDELWSQIEGFTESDKEREAMIKDLRLIEAALATDKIVISLDEKVRNLFEKAADEVDELKEVVWVNPAKPEEKAIFWLKNGAAPEKERKLGFRSEEVG